MKKLFFFFCLIGSFFSINLMAQNQYFYLPNGNHYIGKAKTINEINKELNEEYVYVYSPDESEINDTSLIIMGFKLFTNIPLWVLTYNPKIIQKTIKSFDLEKFMNSWEFEFELEKYIYEGTLTDIFILKTLGPPSHKSKYFDKDIQIELWTYLRFNITLTLTNGIVKSYIKIE